jgi:release factor glutamine methyltransferase
VRLLSVGDALRDAVDRLGAAGVPEPRADAEVLLAHALGTTRAGVMAAAARPLDPAASSSLDALVARRAAREPVQHLVGVWEFWSLPIAVDRRVLVPRPETEVLVETALRVAPEARRVLDVGTGSGAIAAALARELGSARVWASDREPDALAVARANLARLAPDVGLVRGDLLAPFRAGALDLVVSNPPYVAEGEVGRLAPEVRDHEPRTALAAGPDGLAVLGALVTGAPRVLVPGGWLVVEVGTGQAEAVRARLGADGRYAAVETVRDHAGIERVLAARRGG